MNQIYLWLLDNPYLYLPLGIIAATSYLVLHREHYQRPDRFEAELALLHWLIGIFFWPLIPPLIILEVVINFLRSLRK